jgi:acyl-coenzyme A thioesterase PaaI-like protein
MEIRTHNEISRSLCGCPTSLANGYAKVVLTATEEMKVDDQGLVHGGFVFGLADHAAMLAVNAPFVVLGASEGRFLAPVRVGQEMVAEAKVQPEKSDRKRQVDVSVEVSGEAVFLGVFTTFSLSAHVLEG